ncbi:AraC family transcriptional regulator [Flexivirga oryzae]|nr:AraC family transcriptional regulator [Flexivirga oryzae]
MNDPECTDATASESSLVAVKTDQLAAAEGRARWSAALDQTFCEMDVDWPGEGGPFRAELTARPISDLSLSMVHADPHTVVRSPAMIDSDAGEDYILCLVTGGSATLGQDGRTGVLGGGAFGIVDASRPFFVSGTTEFAQVVLRIPRAELDSRASRGIIDSAVGVAVPAKQGVGRLASNLIVDVATHGDDVSAGSASAIATALLDMVVTAVNDVTTPVAVIDRVHADDIRRVQRIMLRHIDDSDRTIADIGAEAGMSVRYVHKLFSAAGGTPRAWLSRQRLERARTMLLQTDLGVVDVCAQTGFKDPSHFSRAFRRAFGASPAQYRTQRGQSGRSGTA